MSLKSARDAGTRRPAKHGGKSLLAPTLGVHTTELGESRENLSQKHCLEAQFTTSPAVNAAKTVLHSQLLQGGLKLVRNGEDAKPVKFGETDATTGQRKKGITPDFEAHLNAYWLPFAKDLIDSFLKWGLVAVVFQEMPEDTHGEALAKLKREIGMAVDDATIKRKRDQPKVLIPLVPMLGTYEIAWRSEGTFGYSRQYILYNNAPGHATRADPTARVFVREHPDNVGNLNSPLATVYQQGSFVSSLVEMAFQAELSRTTPSIVTQLRKPEKGADLSAGALFFDADSRNLAAGQDGEESSKAARDLELQAQLCRVINSMQTQGSRGDGPGSSSAAPRFSPPDVAPKLFTLPKVFVPRVPRSTRRCLTLHVRSSVCRTTSSRRTCRSRSRAATSRRSSDSRSTSSVRARRGAPSAPSRPSNPDSSFATQAPRSACRPRSSSKVSGTPVVLSTCAPFAHPHNGRLPVLTGKFSNNSTVQYARASDSNPAPDGVP